MSDIKLIRHENIPCWYELGWKEKDLSITLSLHRETIEAIKSKFTNSALISRLRKELKLKKFEGDFNGNFGFGGSLIRRDERQDFVDFAIKLPKIHIVTDEICPKCKGKKENEHGMDCIDCAKTGKKTDIVWDEADNTSASLTVLLSELQYPTWQTSSSKPQLLTVFTITRHEAHGGSLGGEYSSSLCSWLGSRAGLHLPEVEKAMYKAYVEMMTDAYVDDYRFRATVESADGWLNISCPGDGCGLHPADGWLRKGHGYEWACHNVDHAGQQLTLIAGLAALHDQARRSIF
ncbi:MAG TPA: hypothetical protein VFA52_03225 [Candidatus Paceibacterota bacterium]|nr:hypothetical protein [Candidatus Paceibacterota bacterium]